jgi:hypothetical protein
MTQTIALGVFRRLDNRFEGQSDESPRALELHIRRKEALHAVFGIGSPLTVLDWGDTDDTRPHEFVELSLASIAGAAFTYAVVPGLKWLGEKLAEKAIDAGASEVIKYIVSKLRPQQEAKQLLDIIIRLPDGTQVAVDPPDRGATILLSLPGGASLTVNYKTDQAERGN